MIEQCSTTHEFLEKYYLSDIPKIIYKVAPQLGRSEATFEDTRSFVCRSLLSQTRVEKYDATRGSSFRTYMFMSIKSLVYTSLVDSQRDRNFKMCHSIDKLMPGSESSHYSDILPGRDFIKDSDTRIDLEIVLKTLEEYDLKSIVTQIHSSDLLRLYISENSNTEISEKIDMTVAGVGMANKRLRSLINDVHSGKILTKMKQNDAMFATRERARSIKDARMRRKDENERRRLLIPSRSVDPICSGELNGCF